MSQWEVDEPVPPRPDGPEALAPLYVNFVGSGPEEGVTADVPKFKVLPDVPEFTVLADVPGFADGPVCEIVESTALNIRFPGGKLVFATCFCPTGTGELVDLRFFVGAGEAAIFAGGFLETDVPVFCDDCVASVADVPDCVCFPAVGDFFFSLSLRLLATPACFSR